MADESGDNQQFDQVLSRLDALMKRSQVGEVQAPATPETLSASQEPTKKETLTESALTPEDSNTPFVILEENIEIPVLTEIYEGAVPEVTSDSGEELAEAVIDALMPLMLENLDIIVAEEAARMQQNIAERLRIEIAEALRARLRQKD
jgi:hypothetical protein